MHFRLHADVFLAGQGVNHRSLHEVFTEGNVGEGWPATARFSDEGSPILLGRRRSVQCHTPAAWTSFFSEAYPVAAPARGLAAGQLRAQKKTMATEFILGSLWPAQHLHQLYNAISGQHSEATSSQDDGGTPGESTGSEHDAMTGQHGGASWREDSDGGHHDAVSEQHGGATSSNDDAQVGKDEKSTGSHHVASHDGAVRGNEGRNIADELAARTDDLAQMMEQFAKQGRHFAKQVEAHGKELNDVANKVASHGTAVVKQLSAHSAGLAKELGEHGKELGPDIGKLAKEFLDNETHSNGDGHGKDVDEDEVAAHKDAGKDTA